MTNGEAQEEGCRHGCPKMEMSIYVDASQEVTLAFLNNIPSGHKLKD
jgi:hypothetical protein